MKNPNFVNGEYYHIYNRGVDKREIFGDDYDYLRFLKSIREFNQEQPVVSLYIKDRCNSVAVKPLKIEKLVDVVAYNLLPNHFHFILKQLKKGGIPEFMKRLGGGYTWYFNYKNRRTGSLFQGTYRSIHIDSNEYLLYLSAYINGNDQIHRVKKFKSSMRNYLESRADDLCNPKVILSQFKELADYKKYLTVNVNEIKGKREDLKKYLLEE